MSEVEEKTVIPEYCKGCLWIKEKKDSKELECRYEGEHYDDFDENAGSNTLNYCHSKEEEIEAVDWSEYD